MPCGDEAEHFATKQIFYTTSSHPQHSEAYNCCSPFCSCACCGSIIGFFEIKIDIKSYAIPHPMTFEFSKELNIISTPSVWRPPKFC